MLRSSTEKEGSIFLCTTRIFIKNPCENGNLTRKIEAYQTDSERISTYTYNENGQILSATIEADTNTEEATTVFTYDSTGNLSSITDPENNSVLFNEYDHMGNILQMQDALNNIWNYTYDSMGRLIAQSDPFGYSTGFEYDGANNRTAIINSYLKRFDFEYDDHNNLIKAIDPYQKYIENKYNTNHLVTRTTDKEGKEIYYEYDNEGRLIKTIDGADNETVYHYDETQATLVSSYKPVRIDYPTFSRRIYYNNMQRVIREVDILSENETQSKVYKYDAIGRLISKTDEQENKTQFEYDDLNRLIKTIDPMNGITERIFDDRDNLIRLIDPNGGITQYEYDRNNRLTKIIRPMGQETNYTYDAAGNKKEIIDAKNQKILYEYDIAGRLIKTQYFSPQDHNIPLKTVDFTYNKLNQLKSYDDGTTSAVYVYDDLQRKTVETVDYGDFSLSYTYTYLANDLKESFTGPDGITYTYTYDSNNRLSSVNIPGKGQITYNSYHWNSPEKVTLPGGSVNDYTYDPLMRIKSVTAKDPAQNVIMYQNYIYSPIGNMIAKNTEHGNYTYEYDDLYRLVYADNPTMDNENYTYDSLGNRLTSEGGDGTLVYNANNELLSYSNTNYQYDDNGNMTYKSQGDSLTQYFIYDTEDRFVMVKNEHNTVIASYYYDPFGRRLWKEVEDIRTYFLYSDEGLIGVYDSVGSVVQTYGYKPDSIWTSSPYFQKQGDEYYLYINDYQGSSIKAINFSGKLVWSKVNNSFGIKNIQLSEIENNLGFSGQYYDSEIMMYYNWNRYYDSKIGRYLRVDPFGDGLNLYSYAFNNPLFYFDPNGLCLMRVDRAFRGLYDAFMINTGLANDQYIRNALERGDMAFAEKHARTFKKYQEIAIDKLTPDAIKILVNTIKSTNECGLKDGGKTLLTEVGGKYLGVDSNVLKDTIEKGFKGGVRTYIKSKLDIVLDITGGKLIESGPIDDEIFKQLKKYPGIDYNSFMELNELDNISNDFLLRTIY